MSGYYPLFQLKYIEIVNCCQFPENFAVNLIGQFIFCFILKLDVGDSLG